MILRSLLITPLFISIFSSQSLGETISIASGEWAPYQSENLKYEGVASRIVRESLEKEGYQVKFSYFSNWARALKMAGDGDYSGTFLWSYKKEREDKFYYSDTILNVDYVFFHLKENPFDWYTISDLKGKNIGGTIGYTYGKAFENAEKSKLFSVERVPKDEMNFEKLLAKRIDILINEIDTGYQITNDKFSKADASRFTHHKLPVRKAPHFLLISRKSSQSKILLKRFNQGLKNMRLAGTIDKYLAESRQGKYFIEKKEEKVKVNE